MARIRSRRNPHSAVTLAALVAATLPLAVHAAEEEKPRVLPKVSVEATEDVPFRATESANPKFTQPLLDTPQTVQVIKKEVLQEQGAASLMEALRNTPGITMQLGENGNTSAGDTFMMRGFSTQSSMFIDGIRDLGAITRDVFNLEQVEIAKGPAGADIGRGAASGYINLISKLPTRDGLNGATLGFGTAQKKRATVDLNQALGETAAVRLNAMYSDGDVDKRDMVENQSYAIAPSFALGLGTPTRFYLYSQHVRQDNVPDGGIPTIGMKGYEYNNPSDANSALINAGAKVDRSNFYGGVADYEDVNADMVTAKIEHDLGNGMTVRNISRYGQTKMDRMLTGVSLGATGISSEGSTNPADWTVSRSRQRVDQENEILANQTSLSGEASLGGFKHTFVGGLEFLYERQKTETFSTTGLTTTRANLYAPNPLDPLPTPFATGAYTDGKTTTAAVYLFDSMELTPQWLLNGGLRFEHYRLETNGATGTAPTLTPVSLSDSDNLLSWKAGVVYKPAPNGSIYASYATSLTPPGGDSFSLSTVTTNASNSAFDPQETENIELGTKWDLLNDRLSLAGAIFRTENDKQVSTDPLTSITYQFGKTRVDGIELNLVGQITNFWQITAGIQKLRTKVIDQYSTNGTQTEGIRWTPDLTATLWTSYTLGDFTLGGGARYVSDQERQVSATTAAAVPLREIPSYWVADMMAAYRISKQINLRLNVYNLFDKEYIETLNNAGTRMRLGVPRSAMLAAEFTF